MNDQKTIFSIDVKNEPGELARIVGLFSGRWYNIESLNVTTTIDSTISRITLITNWDNNILEQIRKQVEKLINVTKVKNITFEKNVQRELVLIKVKAIDKNRSEILRIVDIFKTKIVNVEKKYFIIEISADNEEMKSLINLLKPMGIIEITKSGAVAMVSGK